MTKPALGVMLRRELRPEHAVDFSRRTEAAGFDALWIVEDCFFAGGISTVTLARTERIQVGLGITPAVARSPAFSAMEFAALARYFPGRFLAGIGHGVTAWLDALVVARTPEECATAIMWLGAAGARSDHERFLNVRPD